MVLEWRKDTQWGVNLTMSLRAKEIVRRALGVKRRVFLMLSKEPQVIGQRGQDREGLERLSTFEPQLKPIQKRTEPHFELRVVVVWAGFGDDAHR